LNPRETFLRDVLFSNAFAGMVQRGNIYVKAPCELKKAKFRYELKGQIENYAESLTEMRTPEIVDENHNALIEGLSNDLSRKFPDLLKDSRFRIGSSQKVVNLYLKLLWCANLAPEPPHCPIDGVVIRKLLCQDDLWTELDSVCDYKSLIQLCRTLAKHESIANWELREYANVADKRAATPAM
jgi:hypothetical protein